jgi:hypothetical protein
VLPIVARADTSANVTVTAIGYVCGAPGGLTLTYINDYEVGISWIKGVDADNTMIRAAYGRYPTDRTDGYLVYYGDGTSTSDTGVSLDETATPVYYRAWSENAGGIWNEFSYAESFIEGIGVTLLAFLIAAIGLTIGGYHLKSMPLVYGAGGVWAVLSGYSYQQAASVSFDTWDTFGMLFWIAIAMIIVCMVEPVIYRKSKALAEETADAIGQDDEADPDFDEYVKDRQKMRQQLDKLHSVSRQPRKRLSKFNRTGEIE